jgi:PAS domain S-box-containing protein
MKSFSDQKVRLAFGFAILILLLTGAISYRSMTISNESAQWVRHTHDVLETVQDLNLTMEGIESASRGFALTGKESDLENYGASVSRAERDQAAILTLTEDNPAQQIHFPMIGIMAAERIQHADMVINLRRSEGIAAAAASVASWGGEPIEGEYQAIAGKMQQEELRLLALRRAEIERDRKQNMWSMILGTLVGVLVAIIAARSVLAESASRKVSDGSLREIEEMHQLLLDVFPDYAIFTLDKKGQVASWNAGAERVKGYTAKEIIGQNYSRFFTQGDVARHKPEEILRTAAVNGRFEEVAKRVRKDGSEFLAAVTDAALRDAAGNLRGFSSVIHDLTAIQESEARYRGLLEAAPDGMVVVNEAGEIVLLNAQAEKQFGFRRDELLGRNVKDIIPEGFAERLIADALRTSAEARAQQIGTGIELHGRRKDGTQFPIEIMLSPLESADGVQITAAIRDISERKQLARQLHQSQKMEAVGQLTGGIAHDFNNLLGVIIGNLYLLDLLVTDNEAAVKRVKTAQKAAMRGVDITRRLLVFSSNEELKPAFVMLGDSIQNMIEMASRGLGLDIKITTQVDPMVPALFVDPAALESALLNLVVNARDAMPKGGSIVISSLLQNLDDSHPVVRAGDLKEGCYACVSVTDTGQGMSRETVQRAFEPFFTTKPNNRGTGLGLAMVYGFAKQSGGIVRIYSELGHGTTVSFYLPIVADLSHPVPTVPPNPFGAKLGGTVLVVDDEADLLELALVYLEEMGITALQAKDGASALETIAQNGEIDLMVTDIVMDGGMNGAELVQKARVLRPGLKIIYSSGFPAEGLAEKTMSLVDGPLLRKPYQRTEFAAIVHSVMESCNRRPAELEDSLAGR